MLTIAPTIHGAEPPTPEVRTVVHVHGLNVLPESDGYPEAWFTNGFAQTGPFAPLAGTWSGEGTITTSNGGSERIRCSAKYTIGEGGRAFQQALTCASDSYKFEISSNVETDGTKVTGTWSEATRGVSGSLSGRISGPNIFRRWACPPIESAPSVFPWNDCSLAMKYLRCGSPRSTKYCRAIFSADSIASDPPLTK